MTPSDTEIFVFFTYLIKGNKIDPKMLLKYFEKKFEKKFTKMLELMLRKMLGMIAEELQEMIPQSCYLKCF